LKKRPVYPYPEKKTNEGSATQEFATAELRTAEENAAKQNAPINSFALDYSSVSDDIAKSQVTVGQATAFTTTSEIRYEQGNFNHEMRELDNGGVAVTRDLTIDLLKIENLRGDHYDESRNAGSVFLSNWRSRGDTKISSHQ